jgi:hypothetical protein
MLNEAKHPDEEEWVGITAQRVPPAVPRSFAAAQDDIRYVTSEEPTASR